MTIQDAEYLAAPTRRVPLMAAAARQGHGCKQDETIRSRIGYGFVPKTRLAYHTAWRRSVDRVRAACSRIAVIVRPSSCTILCHFAASVLFASAVSGCAPEIRLTRWIKPFEAFFGARVQRPVSVE